MRIRPARREDVESISAIYAPEVLHGTASFETEPPDDIEMAARLARVQARGWPWLVMELDEQILGYAYASQFRDRPAYAVTCENSIYMAASARGRGLGLMLLQALIAAAREAGFRQMIAVVGDAEGNIASQALHRRAGFKDVGRLRDVGTKFGKSLDVAYLQRSL
ncbi:phosphinothricin N-acetyltransferase [Polymorphobacter multimanifer]|uniref:Phosphinothricin acetyltransferase n=1 Tax=Polymorphobacter multimanifer TaxID=1070431 RepID=A0A841LFS3_9SPHN|nr:GNAT family N-acetyltransferase [Polymorphobacter multimanifer]MBB6228655.1 phosphinothricin acetyltransferase [Polymorphobacter multimanifer]GGI91226.1 phosphinothricin N-acetyltransferase [Polymorphobacter multimanifer]